MARNASTPHSGEREETAATVAPATVLELLDDRHARAVLSTVVTEAKPAREVCEAVSASRATVYRRLNSLENAGLVRSGIAIDADGHHRQTYRAVLSAVTVSVEPDGVSVTVRTESGDDGPRRVGHSE